MSSNRHVIHLQGNITSFRVHPYPTIIFNQIDEYTLDDYDIHWAWVRDNIIFNSRTYVIRIIEDDHYKKITYFNYNNNSKMSITFVLTFIHEEDEEKLC